MSNFYCEQCGVAITEGKDGRYVTGCEHYPVNETKDKLQDPRKVICNLGWFPEKPQAEVSPTSLFNRCVEQKLMKDGTLEIHCKRGNWCVIGIDHDRVKTEALHYWYQYKQDGEYDSLLSNAESEVSD